VDDIDSPIHPPQDLPTDIAEEERNHSSFEMSFNRGLTTVTAAYKEYTDGLDGKPSVKAMNTKYKARWRSSAPDRTHWSRRKVLYSIVESLSAASDNSPVVAARDLDRMKDMHSKSIDWIQKNKHAALAWFYSD
jgi:hypothetical protein